MTTNGPRREVLSRILAGGARIDGQEVSLLGDLTGRLSNNLRQAGAGSGSLVIQAGLQGRELLIATLATWAVDAVPLPCSKPPQMDVTRSAYVMDQAGTVRAPAVDAPVEEMDSTLALHLSSGSTGRPKAVRRGTASVLGEAHGYRVKLGMGPASQVLVPIPLMHSFGWGFAVSALLNGADVDAEPVVRMSRLAGKIDGGWGEVLGLTPPVARLLTDTRPTGTAGRLRTAMVGAGPVSEGLAVQFRKRFGVPLSRGYGSSETGAIFIGKQGIGNPIPGVEITHPAPGARGELRLRMDAPVQGYLGEEPDSAHEWNTGDIVDHHSGGEVHFVERARPALRLNGRFVDVKEADEALRALPGVEDVYLFALPRKETPEQEDFCAVVAGPDADRAEAERVLRRLVDGLAAPRVVLCEKLPVDIVGKPDREELKRLVTRGD
ncbi:Acyl-CoA synthetase (AMP-forming)/AMP-acid ligase II [Streptomyces sp. WMMB 322]|nr:Acyl-CoA synthetase (AMP-forming)/AMP-acid ligase II [Streptomyces sp. WMMB 322]